MTTPSFALAWYAQWSAAAMALADVHDEELRALSDVEALRRADALLSMPLQSSLPEQRRSSSGLVEQQTLFARRRR